MCCAGPAVAAPHSARHERIGAHSADEAFVGFGFASVVRYPDLLFIISVTFGVWRRRDIAYHTHMASAVGLVTQSCIEAQWLLAG